MMIENDQSSKASSAEGEFDGKQLTKLLVEFGPLLVFFITNWQAGKFIENPKQAIFYGTGAFMAATLVALIASRALLGRIPTMPLVSGFFVLVFGGLTLWLQNDEFIKLKPTIVNTLFAAILFGGLANGQTLLKLVFGDVFKLTEDGWRKLTIRWGCFFIFLALLNEMVWRSFSTDFWVSFKVFGIMPITMIFALAQVGLLKRHELR
jgi:intracellular septation protein